MRITNTSKVQQDGFCALIAGNSGVGKTSLAKTLPSANTLVISQESGLLCLKGTSYDTIEIETWEDFTKVASGIKSGNIYKAFPHRKEPFRNYFIDSLTEIMDNYVAELKPQFPDKKNTFQMWGMYLDMATHYIKYLRDTKHANVFMTCLTKKEQDGMNQIDQFDFAGSKLKDKIKSYFDEVFLLVAGKDEGGNSIRYLITDESESSLAKDRSGLLERKIVVPKVSNALSDIMQTILK